MSGWAFLDILDRLAELSQPDTGVRWITLTGLDGYRSCVALDDARKPEVLLADRLAGEPLGVGQGAPCRLITPRQYGYKSVKHVVLMEYCNRYDDGSARWASHPRGRVDREERSAWLPGWTWRRIWPRVVEHRRRNLDA